MTSDRAPSVAAGNQNSKHSLLEAIKNGEEEDAIRLLKGGDVCFDRDIYDAAVFFHRGQVLRFASESGYLGIEEAEAREERTEARFRDLLDEFERLMDVAEREMED